MQEYSQPHSAACVQGGTERCVHGLLRHSAYPVRRLTTKIHAMRTQPIFNPSLFDQSKARVSVPLRRAMMALLVTSAMGSSMAMAQADGYAEVNRLLRSGQLTEALNRADQYLSSTPRDPQMRFIKGVIQTEGGKVSDAIATFSKLTEEFPELPEPYNNLAVLYASQSQFDKARAALEMAIRTNPSYATAHENLGDVYAKLASNAYSKALQLDSGNAAVPPKLSLIRNLFAADAKGAKFIDPSPSKAVAVSKPSADAPTTPTVISPAVAPKSTEVAGSAQEEVEASVKAWAKAWSSKNMRAYLGSYAAKFSPPGGQSRNEWESDRKARILPRARIGVEVSDLSVKVNGDSASAQFRQAYTSDTLNSTSRKTLEMMKTGDRWLIVSETTGS